MRKLRHKCGSRAVLESQVLRPALASKGAHPLACPSPALTRRWLRTKPQGAGQSAVKCSAPTERHSQSPGPTLLLNPAKVNHVKSLNLSQLVLTAYTWTDSFNFYFFKLKKLDMPVSEKYF